ncbi:REP-associated tyrosine transposase [Legionella adelaidensis]|uniref:REP-associated tyrosine transposase n=1 Tax=Legionella adelaidensis TaxID=45056 RepID=UPI0038994371
MKTEFTRQLVTKGIKIPRNNRGEYLLWQRRFWEHLIRDEADFEKHINYIHYNPVKHALVKNPIDWPHLAFISILKKEY